MEPDAQDRESSSSRIAIGVMLMLFGLALLADRMGIAGIDIDGRYWPFILLVIGFFRFIDPGVRAGRPRSRRTGAWLLYIGCWGILNEFHLFGLDYDTSWPLMIVGAGLAVIWRAVDPDEVRPARGHRDERA